MADINSINIIGRLTKDADLKYTNGSNPMAICNFSIAVNRRKKGGADEASFFDVSLIGKAAETLRPYLVKGKQVAISGFLRQDRWTSTDGQAKSKVYIGAEEVELLGGNNGAGNSSAGSYTDDNYGNVEGGNYAGGYDVGITY